MKAISDEPAQPRATAPSVLVRIGRFAIAVASAMMIVGFGLVAAAGIYLLVTTDGSRSDEIDGFYIGAGIGAALMAGAFPLFLGGLVIVTLGGAWLAATGSDQQLPPPGESPFGRPPIRPDAGPHPLFGPDGTDSSPPLPPPPPPLPPWEPPQPPNS